MRLPFGTDEDLDRLFAGSAADDRTRDLAFFFADVKDAAMALPTPEKAAQHVAALSAEAVRLAPEPVAVGSAVAGLAMWRRMMDKNLPRLGKAAAGVMAASMSMIGLAYAGVDLPGTAAERALEAVSGLELPNQGQPEDAGKSVADDVKAVVESDAEKGCSFGRAVAAAASRNRQGEGGSDTDPCAAGGSAGQPQGSRATGEEASAEGRAKAAEHSGGASDAGAGNASNGGSNAGEQSGGASEAGASNSDAGRATAEEHSGGAGDGALGGSDTGMEASTEGRSNAPVEVPPGN
jgi:hypothetical protein